MDQMQDFALDGQRILILNDEYYFVSPSLKQVLERAGEPPRVSWRLVGLSQTSTVEA